MATFTHPSSQLAGSRIEPQFALVIVKQLLKGVLQSTVASTAPALWRLRGRSLLILMYHRVLPEGHPARAQEQPGMYISPETLALHIGVLGKLFSFVDLDEWLERAQQGRALPSRACALTFDDGWRDNYEYAYPILRRAGVPATIYLVSDLVGTQYTFWPNTLLQYLDKHGLDDAEQRPSWLTKVLRELSSVKESNSHRLDSDTIERVIHHFKETCTDAEMLTLIQQLQPSQNPDRDLLSWAEAREMMTDGVVRFGSHTRHHTRLLPRVDIQQIREEVHGSRLIIEQQLGVAPRTFCYPNGDFFKSAVDVVREAYIGAVTTRRGWNSPTSDRFRLNRVGLHEDVSRTRSAFLSRLSGIG